MHLHTSDCWVQPAALQDLIIHAHMASHAGEQVAKQVRRIVVCIDSAALLL